MGLDKSIAHGKEKRNPYRKSQAFDYSCRTHGSCDHCRLNRLIRDRRLAERLEYESKDPDWPKRKNSPSPQLRDDGLSY